MTLIALLFRVKDMGPIAVSALYGSFTVARVLMSPYSGTLVDRYRTRPLVRAVSFAQAGLCAYLAFADGWLVYALLLPLSVGGTIIRPAWQAYLPTLVEQVELPRVYATMQTYSSLAMVAGAGLGGVVVGALGTTASLLVDAATFVFVGLTTLALTREREPATSADGRMDVFRGFKAIFGTPVLFSMFLLLTLFNMCAGSVEVLGVYLVTDVLGGGPASYGVVSLMFGASMFVVGRILSGRTLRWDNTVLVIWSALIAAAGIVLFGLAPAVWFAALAFMVNGVGLAGLNIYALPVMIAHSKDEERGRIFAASSALTGAGFVASLGVFGAVGEVLSARTVIVGSGILCIALTVWNGSRVLRAVQCQA